MQYFSTFLLFLLCGCLPKASSPILLHQTQIETELTVQSSSGDWSSASAELATEFQRSLGVFGAGNGANQATVQLQLGAHYFSQLQGQHRWIVSGSIALILDASDSAEATIRQDVDLPVFLDHPHQGADDALLASLPLLKRQVQNLILAANEQSPADN